MKKVIRAPNAILRVQLLLFFFGGIKGLFKYLYVHPHIVYMYKYAWMNTDNKMVGRLVGLDFGRNTKFKRGRWRKQI